MAIFCLYSYPSQSSQESAGYLGIDIEICSGQKITFKVGHHHMCPILYVAQLGFQMYWSHSL